MSEESAIEPLTVELPEPLRQHVEHRAAAAGFGTAGEFVRDLIERDRERLGRLESLVREGLESGDFVEMDDAWWARKFAEFDERFGDGTAA